MSSEGKTCIDISVRSAGEVGKSFYVKYVVRFIKDGTSSWMNMLVIYPQSLYMIKDMSCTVLVWWSKVIRC